MLIDYEAPDVIQRFFPGAWGGNDREGRPIYILRIGDMDVRGLMKALHSDEAWIRHVRSSPSAMPSDDVLRVLDVVSRRARLAEMRREHQTVRQTDQVEQGHAHVFSFPKLSSLVRPA